MRPSQDERFSVCILGAFFECWAFLQRHTDFSAFGSYPTSMSFPILEANVNEHTVGHCLHTYLKHESVLSVLESEDGLPADLRDEEATITAFKERASEQAVSLLEGLHTGLASGGTVAGYRAERRSQRRTVREYWYVQGRLFRPRERSARTVWYLCLGCLKDKGPAATLILKPHDPVSTAAIDRLASVVAVETGLESGSARDCFARDRGFDCGVLAATVSLDPMMKYSAVIAALKKQSEVFAREHRERFEQALESSVD